MRWRKWSEFAIFLLYFFVPYLNWFRIDIPNGHYYWFTLKFSFSQSLPLLLTILWLVFLVIGLNFFKPRMFCSHMCPHGTTSQWFRALKKRKLDIPVAVLMTPLISFTMIAYFIDPGEAWKGIAEFRSPMVAAFFAGLCLFIGLLLIRLRQKFCANVCPYGFFQQLFTPEKTSKGRKIAVSGVLLVLAGTMTAAALLAPRTEMVLGSSARMKTGLDTMTYTYNLRLVNGQAEPETFTIQFHALKPVGNDFEKPITLQPGEEKVLPFAFQAKQTEHVQFDVTAERESRTKSFEFTLSGL